MNGTLTTLKSCAATRRWRGLQPIINHGVVWINPNFAIILVMQGTCKGTSEATAFAGGDHEFFQNWHFDNRTGRDGRFRAVPVSGFTRVDTRVSPAPSPLAAAPAGQVQTGQLPPPGQPGVTDPSQFPAPPGQDDFGTESDSEFGETLPTGETQVASLPPQGAPEVTAGSVAGVWNATVAGQGCRIATPQTRFGEGFPCRSVALPRTSRPGQVMGTFRVRS